MMMMMICLRQLFADIGATIGLVLAIFGLIAVRENELTVISFRARTRCTLQCAAVYVRSAITG